MARLIGAKKQDIVTSPNIHISLEHEVYISKQCKIYGSISIGAYSYFGANCSIACGTFGRFCSFASNINIGPGEHEPTFVSTHPFFFNGSTNFSNIPVIGIDRDLKQKRHQSPKIGHDVWCGANVIIRRGVNIGNGAILASGSVITKDVPAYAIVGGVPAKLIKYRFEPSIICELNNIQWWNYNINIFTGLDSSNPLSFCKELKKRILLIKNKEIESLYGSERKSV